MSTGSRTVLTVRTTTFFSRIHSETPIINQDRYIASLYMPPHMQPPMCLQYILMAQAATISPVHKQLAEPFYRRARRYAEEDEMKVRLSPGLQTTP